MAYSLGGRLEKGSVEETVAPTNWIVWDKIYLSTSVNISRDCINKIQQQKRARYFNVYDKISFNKVLKIKR